MNSWCAVQMNSIADAANVITPAKASFMELTDLKRIREATAEARSITDNSSNNSEVPVEQLEKINVILHKLIDDFPAYEGSAWRNLGNNIRNAITANEIIILELQK